MDLHKNLLTKKAFLYIPIALLLALIVILGSSRIATAAPQTFTVTNTNDSGAGSLRQALNDANSNGNPNDMDVIEFDIPGPGPHTISPTSEMTAVLQKLTIDGFSQTGANANTASYPEAINSNILIEIDGSNTTNAVGIKVQADEVVIKGLSIIDFGIGINAENDEVYIHGNYIGMRADGVTEAGNTQGLGVIQAGANSRIGGTDPENRNVIAGNTEINLNIFTAPSFGGQPADGLAVWGNLIGVNKNKELLDSDQGVGILVNGETNEIIIGGTDPLQGNYIVGTGGTGVGISRFTAEAFAASLDPSNVTVIGNSIFNTKKFSYEGFGNTDLGIDILELIDTDNPPDGNPNTFGDRGPTANDEGDADTGPNTKINSPELKSAYQNDDQITITYDLDVSSSPSNTYRVEFFASSERTIFGHGPGENLIGVANNISPGENQSVTLNVDDDFKLDTLSATTTAIDATKIFGFGGTSEFSRNITIGSNEDFDADGVSDSIENGAPNNGDGNNDGTPDRLQPTVTSYIANGVNGQSTFATLITEGCSENGTVSSLTQDSLQVKDNGFKYPFGLTDFVLYCSRGDEVDVTMLIHTEEEPEKYMPRKFNPSNQTFYDIPGSNLVSEVLGTSKALKLTYSIQDGGELDDDGEENGIIVDPVGLAVESSSLSPGQLVNTGMKTILPIVLAVILISLSVYTYVDYRKHKKPLEDMDKEMNTNIAKQYTFWHHLKVVTIPLAKYRLIIRLERKATIGKSGLFNK